MGFFSNIINTVKQATRSRFELNKDTNTLQLLLDTKDENYFTLEFETMEVENLYDPSVLNAYKIIGSNDALGTLHIEAVRLKQQHEWNCSPGSAFIRFVTEQFKKNELKYIESFETDFVKLTKYEKDFENEIGVIWFSLNQFDVFIVDFKGRFFNDLIEIYSVRNPDLPIKDSNSQLQNPLNGSMTEMNLREDFFSQESR